MRVPLEISFKNVEPNSAMEALVRERVDRLSRYHRGIIACRVAVEAPHLSPNEEAVEYRVRVEVSIPGTEVVATTDRGKQSTAEHDPYNAVRASFSAVERQLKSRAGRQRRGRHPRVGPPHAVVAQLFPGEDYGFIRAGDGREIYFHRNSVINDRFDSLEVGDEVRFEEAQGEKGPQASTVSPVGQHGTHLLS